MKKRTIALTLVFILLLTLLCGCGNDKDKPMKKYAGNWISDTKDAGYHYTVEIKEDGAILMEYFESTDAVQWSYDGTLTIENKDGKELMCYTLYLPNMTYTGFYEFSAKSKEIKLTYSEGEHVFNTSELFNDGKVTLVKQKDKEKDK